MKQLAALAVILAAGPALASVAAFIPPVAFGAWLLWTLAGLNRQLGA